MKSPEFIELDIKQVEALLKRVKDELAPEDYNFIKAMADTLQLLSQSLDKKGASMPYLNTVLGGFEYIKDPPAVTFRSQVKIDHGSWP